MAVEFRLIKPDEVGYAHKWHADFAATNDAIYPRQKRDFIELVFDRSIWCAVSGRDEYLGLAYADYDESENCTEIGGLMVAEVARGLGLGGILMRLPLIHFLFEENPYSWTTPPRIIAHVLKGNEAPRRIIPSVGFGETGPVKVPSAVLPGLRCEPDGFVHGTEYELAVPSALHGLSEWCHSWDDTLRDGTPANIKMLKGRDTALWGRALSLMAELPIDVSTGVEERREA